MATSLVKRLYFTKGSERSRCRSVQLKASRYTDQWKTAWETWTPLQLEVFHMSDVDEDTIIKDSSYPINKTITREEGVTPVSICCTGTAAVQMHSDSASPVHSSSAAQPSQADPSAFAVGGSVSTSWLPAQQILTGSTLGSLLAVGQSFTLPGLQGRAQPSLPSLCFGVYLKARCWPAVVELPGCSWQLLGFSPGAWLLGILRYQLLGLTPVCSKEGQSRFASCCTLPSLTMCSSSWTAQTAQTMTKWETLAIFSFPLFHSFPSALVSDSGCCSLFLLTVMNPPERYLNPTQERGEKTAKKLNNTHPKAH